MWMTLDKSAAPGMGEQATPNRVFPMGQRGVRGGGFHLAGIGGSVPAGAFRAGDLSECIAGCRDLPRGTRLLSGRVAGRFYTRTNATRFNFDGLTAALAGHRALSSLIQHRDGLGHDFGHWVVTC